jgi:dTDP-4-amino-4,6-dideoxygalactose transaminase
MTDPMTSDPIAPAPSRPGRRAFLPFHRPSITDADVEAVARALRAGWLTHGPLCQELERTVAATVGARRGVSLSSGTAAMHLALVALGVGEGDEVVTTTFTFCSTAHVVEHVGARPVFADVDPDTLQIDPTSVERVMTDRTAAILPVDYGGHPAPMREIGALAGGTGLPVIEDAAHSLGAAIGRRTVGSLATVTAFSFYATKNVTTGEGGMATTDDEGLADRLESLRLHGISRDAWNRYGPGQGWYYEVLEPGFKANLTDPQAALGLSQLAREPQMRARRTAVAERYSEAFGRYPDLLQLPVVAPDVRPAWHLYPLRLRTEALDAGRDAFVAELADRGIGTSVHFIPLHLQPYFRDRYGFEPGDFPNAEDAYRRLVSLPVYPVMSDRDVEDVIEAVLEVARAHAR